MSKFSNKKITQPDFLRLFQVCFFCYRGRLFFLSLCWKTLFRCYISIRRHLILLINEILIVPLYWKEIKNMSEAESRLVKAAGNWTIYSIQFLSEDESEFERFFRTEGKMSDRVCALLVLKSRLRLYCSRLSYKILILGNGRVKVTRTYNEDDTLKGYVITLQYFDKPITEGIKNGSILVTESTIETENTFDTWKR